MSHRTRLILIVGMVALAIAALATRGFGLFAPRASKVLALSGNVDIRQVDLGFRLGGRIAAIPLEEGARVTAGGTLAQLDTQPLKDQLAVDEAQIASASAQLQKQQNGNRSQDIGQAEAKLAELRAQRLKAQEDLDRRAALLASGAISKAVFESTRAQLSAAEAQVQGAEQSLSLQRVGRAAKTSWQRKRSAPRLWLSATKRSTTLLIQSCMRRTTGSS